MGLARLFTVARPIVLEGCPAAWAESGAGARIVAVRWPGVYQQRGHGLTLLGFMPVTIAVALVTVLLISWLATGLADPRAREVALEQYAEELVERDLAERGWRPVGPSPAEGSGPRILDGAAPPANLGRGGEVVSERADLEQAAHRLQRLQGLTLLLPEREFHLDLSPGAITGGPPPTGSAALTASVVARELSRFPQGSLAAARFRRVLLCAGLAEAGRAIPSLPNYQQTLLLDVGSSPEFLRRLVHHELFHFIDYADDDQVLRDPSWDALNDRYFVYGSGGRAMRDPRSSYLTHEVPGFVSRYATAALEEDKAEVFSFLMTAPAELTALGQRDVVIGRKMAAVKRQVGAHLPVLDAAFFRAVERGDR
ncbi:MAG: hypothetical protein JW751_09180 [Polyangiaceae bacterium]|nr:hypothetical protein [Polyangiaceae bacterium]